MYRSSIAVAALSLLVTGVILADDANQSTAKLEGTWNVVSAEMGGQQIPAEFAKQLKLTFAKGVLTIHTPDGDRKADYKVDNSTKPHKSLDITPQSGPNKGKSVPGIYHLDGDDLKVCWSDAGGDRPTEFVTNQGNRGILLVLKRTKKE